MKAIVLLLASVLAGCSLARNTPAQELALESFSRSSTYASVDLDRVDTDGTVWVLYRVAGEIQPWRECMARARRELAPKYNLAPATAAPRTIEKTVPAVQKPDVPSTGSVAANR